MFKFVAWYLINTTPHFYPNKTSIMKKLLLTLIALFISTAITWADDNALVVTFSDGSHQTFLLADLPDVRMANDKMTITAGSTTAEYDLYTVKTFTFGTATTGVKAIEEARMTVQGDALIVPSAKAKVSVYSIDGAAVDAKVSRGSGTTTVDLGSLPTGRVYIINADGKSVKILR